MNLNSTRDPVHASFITDHSDHVETMHLSERRANSWKSNTSYLSLCNSCLTDSFKYVLNIQHLIMCGNLNSYVLSLLLIIFALVILFGAG